MRARFALASLAAAGLLAACSTPNLRAPEPAPPSAPAVRAPAPTPAIPAPAPPPDLWQQLRNDFTMHDCAPPAVVRARFETRHGKAFERQLQRAAPIIAYLREQAAAAHVPGEFALLPWVESHFREIAPRPGRAAGMWQIMPITAPTLHLAITRHYDGRLDKVAATPAVLRFLARFHAQWGDWRLADMAYNTGGYRMARVVRQHGLPPDQPVIPQLPVGQGTRDHLTRLLAIACIVREPARFGVTLPDLPEEQRLRVITLPTPTTLRHAATAAGLPLAELKQLNAGYLGPVIAANTPMQLLLPAPAADTLRLAIASGQFEQSVAATSGSRHTVHRGDSLWAIAEAHGLTVQLLRQWNDLDRDSVLQAGQVLWLQPPPAS